MWGLYDTRVTDLFDHLEEVIVLSVHISNDVLRRGEFDHVGFLDKNFYRFVSQYIHLFFSEK